MNEADFYFNNYKNKINNNQNKERNIISKRGKNYQNQNNIMNTIFKKIK